MKTPFTLGSVVRTARDYTVLTVAMLLYSLTWTIFLSPNNLVGGGVSGLAAIIYYATGVKMGYTYFVVNALLLGIALKILGRSFGVKTVFAVITVSLFLNIMPSIIPQTFINEIAIANGKLLCTLIGATIAGCTIGMAMSVGGSTGGTDIVALMVSKYRNVSPGQLILRIDVVIIATSLILPSYTSDGEKLALAEKLATAVYGFVMVTMSGYVVDLYLSGSKQSVQIFIISQKFEELADHLAFEVKRGVTMIHGTGWFTKNDSNVLMVVARKSDLNTILSCVKAVDSKAFITVASVMGVYGLGFDKIKTKRKTLSEEINQL